MSLKNLVLHVGAGKCGSSTIQTSFSAHPTITAEHSTKAAYGAVLGDGQLVLGDGLTARALRHPSRYLDSRALDDLDPASVDWEKRLKKHGVDTRLFLREAWINDLPKLHEQIISRFSVKPQIVVFVRPQVDYINSAWWQWGAWQGRSLDAWAKGFSGSAQWTRGIERLIMPDGVEAVHVRLLSDAIIADCLDLMNCRTDTVPMSDLRPVSSSSLR